MESLPVYQWTNLNHKKLSEYGNQWRIQNDISIECGEMFLSMFRKQILSGFGIGEQDTDKWTISYSLPYPEPIL